MATILFLTTRMGIAKHVYVTTVERIAMYAIRRRVCLHDVAVSIASHFACVFRTLDVKGSIEPLLFYVCSA